MAQCFARVLLCASLSGCGTGSGPGESHEAANGDTDAGTGFTASCDDPGVLCYDFGPIEVPPGEEWQGFSALDVGNDADLAITGIEIAQAGTTSHHFTVALWTGADPPLSGGPYELATPEGLTFVGDVLGNTLVGSVFKYVKIDNGKYGCSTFRGPRNRVSNDDARRPSRTSQLEIGWTSREPKYVPSAGRASLIRFIMLPRPSAV